MGGNSLLGDLSNQNHEINLCRCCHATGKFKNLSESCSDNGEEEIFADMLKYCFNVEILPIPGKMCAATYTICEVCIGLLRAANRFKKTAVLCEAEFKALASCNKIYKIFLNGNAVSVENDKERILTVKDEKLPNTIPFVDSRVEINEDNISDDDFDSAYDWDFGEAENKIDLKDMVKKPEKCYNKKKKTKSKKKTDESEKIKEETYELERVEKDNISDDDFGNPQDLDFGEGENKIDLKDMVKKPEKCYNKKKKTKSKKKTDESEKIKEETYELERVEKDNISDDDFDSPQDLDFGEGESKIDSEVIVEIPEKYENKKKKTKSKKETDKSEKIKEAPCELPLVKKVVPPKFYIKEEDYSIDGTNFNCKRCDKMYTNFKSLRFHVKGVHYKLKRNLTCPVCNKDFKTISPLIKHKLEEHNIDDRVKCNACTGVFNTKAQLKRHINSFHMLGEKYKCKFCDYECFSFESLYKHKVKHKTSKDHQCKFCRKLFLRKTTKDLHERIHTGDRRKVCSVCGQAFVQKASLNYHMTKYHPEVNF